jgi:hypothetical protein
LLDCKLTSPNIKPIHTNSNNGDNVGNLFLYATSSRELGEILPLDSRSKTIVRKSHTFIHNIFLSTLSLELSLYHIGTFRHNKLFYEYLPSRLGKIL